MASDYTADACLRILRLHAPTFAASGVNKFPNCFDQRCPGRLSHGFGLAASSFMSPLRTLLCALAEPAAERCSAVRASSDVDMYFGSCPICLRVKR